MENSLATSYNQFRYGSAVPEEISRLFDSFMDQSAQPLSNNNPNYSLPEPNPTTPVPAPATYPTAETRPFSQAALFQPGFTPTTGDLSRAEQTRYPELQSVTPTRATQPPSQFDDHGWQYELDMLNSEDGYPSPGTNVHGFTTSRGDTSTSDEVEFVDNPLPPPATSRPRATSSAARAPPSTKPKRKRATTTQKPNATPAGTATRTRKGNSSIKKEKSKKDKENMDPHPAKSADADSDSDTSIKGERDDVSKPRRLWSEEETTQLLIELLGVDSVYWDHFQKNPNRIYKKIARKVFSNTRNAASIKSRYSRLLKTFKGIMKAENWTGNGGKDPDNDETAESIAIRLQGAREAGVAIQKQVTAELVYEWKTGNKWYHLFNDRLREDPTIERPVEHRAGLISDRESIVPSDGDDDNSSSDDEAPLKRRRGPTTPASTPLAKTTTTKLQYQPGVPTPAHKLKRGGKGIDTTAVMDYFATTSAVMESTVMDSKKRMELLENREKRASQQMMLEQCRSIVADPNMSLESRQRAQHVVDKFLNSSLSMFD
ncbi:hypothetical protein FPV67DRAFT_1669948 [Lyophyllum atratum]|nr:hypothetical protein FPV67DRAFT_1669948 [Lyophyllum atratum]